MDYKWTNHIDKIVYINLDHRTDRNIQMITEFTRLNIPSDKIVRLNAVKNKNGAIGCTLSHIKVLQMAIENKWNTLLVLEDDFNFIDNLSYINESIQHLFKDFNNEWKIVSLSRGARQDMNDIKDKYVSKAIAVSTTAGYIVKREFYDILLKNYKEGLNKLLKEPADKQHQFTLDAYWINLQPESEWYVFNPSIGYQRESFSDIEGRMVAYVSYDKTIQFNKPNYLSCSVKGGLGNQMFQIASTCATAWNNNLEPIFEKIPVSPPLTNPRPVYWNTIFHKVQTLSSQDYNKIQFLQFGFQDSYFRPILLPHNKSYRMNGYFQNPEFFSKYKDRILDLFKLKDSHNKIIEDFYLKIAKNSKTVSIHVRRGDYLKLSNIYRIKDMDYFKKCIDLVINKVGNNNLLFLIFSDDLEWCKNNFSKLDINCVYVDENHAMLNKDVIDMYLMSKCNHNIISNSSFSWWSAYMNKNPNKIVCSTKEWMVNESSNSDALNILEKDMILV